LHGGHDACCPVVVTFEDVAANSCKNESPEGAGMFGRGAQQGEGAHGKAHRVHGLIAERVNDPGCEVGVLSGVVWFWCGAVA